MNIEWICEKAGITVEDYRNHSEFLLVQPFFSIPHLLIPNEDKEKLLEHHIAKLKTVINILKTKGMW